MNAMLLEGLKDEWGDRKDCSDIAEELYKAAGNKGKILKTTPAIQGNNFIAPDNYLAINIPENQRKTMRSYYYHQFYTDDRYVFDPIPVTYPEDDI